MPTDMAGVGGSELIPQSVRCEVSSSTLDKLLLCVESWVSMVKFVHEGIMTQAEKAPYG